MEGEIGPDAFWRRRWCWGVIGVLGYGMRWSRFYNLISELGALFVGIVEQGDEVAPIKVAG